ncbi:MAG TPA: hypothetical protein VF807_04005 [Ktedonobacterales bacterium]
MATMKRVSRGERERLAGPPRMSRVTEMSGVSLPRLTVPITIGVLLAIQSAFMLVQVVPTTIWADHGYPNGPIPNKLYPLVAALFYAIPTVVGLLVRRWQAAIVLATLPAWLVLGAFAVGGAFRNGPFYLFQDPHGPGTVGTLELMAFLGALGWLARDLVARLLRKGA